MGDIFLKTITLQPVLRIRFLSIELLVHFLLAVAREPVPVYRLGSYIK